MAIIAYSLKHQKVVIRAGDMAGMDRIIREGEYDRSLLIITDTNPERTALIEKLNRMLKNA